MLKGVNKQILEVTNPESPYFEKIIFFVRPNTDKSDHQKLKTEAEKISASTATRPPKEKQSYKKAVKVAITSFVFMILGMVITIGLGKAGII